MSLDGGYIGSVDHAIANLHVGRRQGQQQGYNEGYPEGYQEGFQEGRVSGWNEAMAVADQKMDAQAKLFELESDEMKKELDDLALDYNQYAVISKVLRHVISDLMRDNPALTANVKGRFLTHYKDVLKNARDIGTINTPLEVDPKFAKESPQTHAFILDMMSVKHHK